MSFQGYTSMKATSDSGRAMKNFINIVFYGIDKKFKDWFTEDTCNWLESYNIKILGLADKNKNIHGKYELIGKTYVLKDIEFFSEEEIDYIVIASERYYKDIIDSLAYKTIILKQFIKKIVMPKRKMHKLSIMTMIRDEGAYIEEWIEYHRMLGVDHFYIYDNESTDETKKCIQKYVESGIVTYMRWEGSLASTQEEALNHALLSYRDSTEYMEFIDADEFIVPLKQDSIYDVVNEIITDYEEARIPAYEGYAGGIGINWRTYGTSFYKSKPVGMVIENYKYRAQDKRKINAHIKTICNPRAVIPGGVNCHKAKYVGGYNCISENGSAIINEFFYDSHCSKIRINHYYTKSEEEFIWRKCERGMNEEDRFMPITEAKRRLESYDTLLNEVYDPIREDLLIKLKVTMAEENK